MATSSIQKKIIIRNSNSISVQVASGGKGSVTTTYSSPEPTGFTLVSRQFCRTDDGGYGVIVFPSLYGNYIVYESTGSAPTLTGYVIDIWMKI